MISSVVLAACVVSSSWSEFYNVSDGDNWKFCLFEHAGPLTPESENESIFIYHHHTAAYFYHVLSGVKINLTNEHVVLHNLILIPHSSKKIVKRQTDFAVTTDLDLAFIANGIGNPTRVLVHIQGIYMATRSDFNMTLYGHGKKFQIKYRIKL